ncbi:MAG: GIY-YIG nuclease family protein [Halofilum sp. (in: g-proteobacteria)]|nr:GIY-YIG nuclease family protein [Halofilum sp. (in: g-proteobacteria)]
MQPAGTAVTYQLFIHLRRACRVAPGALGRWRLPPGWYVYTGSARAGLDARLRRHLKRDKTRRWHVDWLLARAEARVCWVRLHAEAECAVNRATGGAVPVPGFGASDCRAGCGSHLRYLGAARPPAVPVDPAARRAGLARWRARRT